LAVASIVDQITSSGSVVSDADVALSESTKSALLLAALPGASVDKQENVRVVRFEDQVIFKAQVTHLGHPWPAFKKRIQVPNSWVAAAHAAASAGLQVRLIGIYHRDEVTIFVDFDPETYLRRKANNSAAHVATNDLFQAQTLGQFSRTDRNGNRLTSVRTDQLASYLRDGFTSKQPQLAAFEAFNRTFFAGAQIEALDAVKEMHAAGWPDAFQAEWPGFFVEFKLDESLRVEGMSALVEYRKVKKKGEYDFDLGIMGKYGLEFYGDLKASNAAYSETPGNDAADLARCVREFGRFWYVIYEHETTHAKDHGDVATVQWNEWKLAQGKAPVPYNPLSYATRFKASVKFVRMIVLEVNAVNFHVVLGDFAQGRQPGGAARAMKVKIKKKDLDNFLIYSAELPAPRQ
jgi:hypothetical protein